MAAHGRYSLLCKIADGGTAEVFLAHMEGSAGFKRLVVLKRVRPALWADEAFRRSLVDEAHIAMGLHHSNIVQVIDLGISSERYFLAFELVDGWTLSQVIKRARVAGVQIPLNVGLHIMAEVCRGLSYAHGKAEHGVPLAIVHRDVSPQNVLLSEQGEVKLTDFGIARARTRSSTSEIGSVKGKPAYMSPEQAAGSALDARSDLFPIGTMIYQLATGALPFTAPSALEEMAKVLAGKFADPTTLRPELPRELVQLINKALERRVERRFQTAELLLHAIEKLQRTVLEPAGTTELKAWLAELAKKDGGQPLSRQVDTLGAASAAAVSQAPESEPIELQDDDIVISQASELLPGAVVNPAPRGKRWIVGAVALLALGAGTLWAPLRERIQAAPEQGVLAYDAGMVLLTVVVPPAPELVAHPPKIELPDPAQEPDAVELPDAAQPDAIEPVPVEADAGELEPDPGPTLLAAAESVDAGREEPAVAVAPSPQVAAAEDQVSVLIESDPEGAQVRIDKRLFGQTPLPLRLKIGITFELVVSKAGYREQKVLHFVTRRTNQKVRVALVKGR